MKLPNARQVQPGPGDPLSKAFELVVTPAIFGFLGFLLDRRLGTAVLFTVALSVSVLGYLVWKLCVEYGAEMDRHDEGKPWTRQYRRRESVDA